MDVESTEGYWPVDELNLFEKKKIIKSLTTDRTCAVWLNLQRIILTDETPMSTNFGTLQHNVIYPFITT